MVYSYEVLMDGFLTLLMKAKAQIACLISLFKRLFIESHVMQRKWVMTEKVAALNLHSSTLKWTEYEWEWNLVSRRM